MIFCFTNISAKISLDILSYRFCAEHHILVHFCQIVLPLKALKIIRGKTALLLGPKILGILTPDSPRLLELLSLQTVLTDKPFPLLYSLQV
jgi:hypothetical protein